MKIQDLFVLFIYQDWQDFMYFINEIVFYKWDFNVFLNDKSNIYQD